MAMGGNFRIAIVGLAIGSALALGSCGKLQSGGSTSSLSDLLSGVTEQGSTNLGAIQIVFSGKVPEGIEVKIDSHPISSSIQESNKLTVTNIAVGAHKVDISASGYVPYSINSITVAAGETSKTDTISLVSVASAQSSKVAIRLSMSISSVYLGVFNSTNVLNQFADFQSGAPALAGIFIPMAYNGNALSVTQNLQKIQAMVGVGAVPFITWEPWDPTRSGKDILPDIVAGKYDSMIVDWANSMKDLDYPVIIRWGHEMQGNWYPWSRSPQVYRQAFQHMVSIFRAQNANQVMWMFAPNHDDGGTGRNYVDYYPGDQYVDLVGISGYNFGTTQPSWHSTWSSFDDIFGPMVDSLTNRYHLPIVLDVASAEQGGNKAGWISDMGNQLATNPRFASVKGIVWFQEDKTRDGETNWRFDSSRESLTAFQTIANMPTFELKPLLAPVVIRQLN